LDDELNEREHTWIKNYNVLFIDNPVGTGFSWVEDDSLLTTNNSQIARDLVELMRGFYEVLPEFKPVPLHIFGQSYGPKMGVEFAYELAKEIKAGTIESNLTSVGVGNSFVSPIDSTLSWSGFLKSMVRR
jgi:serine carboxypeptidase 1